MLFTLAWRNLWRNKRRTAITLSSIVFGLLISFTFTGLSDGSYQKLIDTAAKAKAGHVTLQAQGYQDHPSPERRVQVTQNLTKSLDARSDIVFRTSRILGRGMIASAGDTIGVGFVGIDPQQEAGWFNLLDKVKTGERLQNADDPRVLIGTGLAKRLEAKLKTRLVVTTTDKDGQVVSGMFRVGGIFESGSDETDKYMVVLAINRARTLMNYQPNESTLVALMIDDQRRSAEVAEQLEPLAQTIGAESLPWFKVLPQMAGFIKIDNAFNYIMQIFIFLLVAAGVFNTVLMGVLERNREFGIMMAVGLKPGRLSLMVLVETLALGISGLLLGSLVSWPLLHYLTHTGLDMTEVLAGQSFSGVMMDPIMRAGLTLDHALFIAVAVLLLTLATGLYPAFLAGRTKPLDVINTL